MKILPSLLATGLTAGVATVTAAPLANQAGLPPSTAAGASPAKRSDFSFPGSLSHLRSRNPVAAMRRGFVTSEAASIEIPLMNRDGSDGEITVATTAGHQGQGHSNKNTKRVIRVPDYWNDDDVDHQPIRKRYIWGCILRAGRCCRCGSCCND